MLESILTVVGTVCLITGAILLIKHKNKTVYGILLTAFICRFSGVAIECFIGTDLPARSIIVMGVPSILGIVLMIMFLCADSNNEWLKPVVIMNVIISAGVLVLKIISGILIPICLQFIVVLIFVRLAFFIFREKE